MIRTEIALADDQYRMLEQIAAREQQSVSEVVQQAIDSYLRRRQQTALAELDALVARIHADIPPGISQEEIEADIAAAREEYRAERRAARGR